MYVDWQYYNKILDTWVVQQHDQIERCVSVLRSKVDISPLTQQVLDNIFISGR